MSREMGKKRWSSEGLGLSAGWREGRIGVRLFERVAQELEKPLDVAFQSDVDVGWLVCCVGMSRTGEYD